MFAKDDNGTLQILNSPVIRGPNGEKWAASVLAYWSPEERKAVGIYEVAVDAMPDGHVLVSELLVKEGDMVRLERVTEIAPVIEPPNPVDIFGDESLKVILSLQNEIRELKGSPPLKDVAELKVELRKTVTAGAALEAEAEPVRNP